MLVVTITTKRELGHNNGSKYKSNVKSFLIPNLLYYA
jgi:hypothetical protein